MKNTGKEIIRNITVGLVALFSMLLLVLCASCSKTVYMPVETTRTEYIDRLKTDSIHITDSIILREKEDTVYLTRWRTEYRDRLRVDSILIRDSISIPYPVEKSLTRWQQVKMDMGGIAIGGLLAVFLIIIIWIIIKK